MGVVNPERFMAEVLPDILAKQDAEPYRARLFVIGCDHFIASPRLPWLAEQIAARVGHPVRVGSLEEMAARVRASGAELAVVRGEQRDPCLAVCPASVCGTRIPLKQANQQVEQLLLGVAEPLQAFAALAGNGADRAHLRWGWRLLAQNHPHDSIPGCSIDAVHREMFTRFARARMVAVDAAQRGAKRLAAALDPASRGELGSIGIISLAGGRSRLRLRLHGADPTMPRFRLVTPDGQDVAFTVLRRGREYVYYHRLQDAFATVAATAFVHLVAPRAWVDERRAHPQTFVLPYVDIELEVDMPRAGYQILRLEPATPAQWRAVRRAGPTTTQQAAIANDYLRVWAGGDGLFLTDQATGRTYGPIGFSHAGEAGDEYTAFPVPEPPVRFAPDPDQARVETDGLGEQLILPISVQVPARLRADRRGRTGRVRLDGRLAVRLIQDRAELGLSLVNRARDYDLRLVAHVPGAVTAHCGAPFGVEDRAFEVSHSSPTAPQQALPDFPMRGWVAAQAPDSGGLAVLARGLYEAAVRRVADGVELAPTLLRGVGYLSRADLETRPGDAGPAIATPDAQCLGPQHWDLALLPFGPGTLDTVPARAEEFLRPAAAFPVQWSAGRASAARTLFTGDERLVVSALKPADEGPGIMLHAYNPTAGTHLAAVPGTRARLDETPAAADGPLGPFAIAAWKLDPAE
jgi:mannosylglycerate hydrolase